MVQFRYVRQLERGVEKGYLKIVLIIILGVSFLFLIDQSLCGSIGDLVFRISAFHLIEILAVLSLSPFHYF